MRSLGVMLCLLCGAAAAHASAEGRRLDLAGATRAPGAATRAADVAWDGQAFGAGLGTATWTLPPDLPAGLYRAEFRGSAPDNPVEWISECEFEPYRFFVRPAGAKEYEVRAFSFVVPGAPVETVDAYRHPQLETPYRLTVRRGDRPIALRPGDQLRLECRWRYALMGDLRLVPVRPGTDTLDVQVDANAPFGLFDTRGPIRFHLRAENLGDAPLRGTLRFRWIDAVAGEVGTSSNPLALPANGTHEMDLERKLPFGAYTLHVEWLDPAGRVQTHVQRHFAYSPYVDAARLPDDWPLGFHLRPGDPMLPPVGFKTLRVFTGWKEMQPQPDRYEWGEMDRMVEYARAHGQKVLWVCNGMPAWATSRPEASNSPKGDLQPYWAYAPRDWKLVDDLVRAFWRRYAPGGKLDVVTSIEVLNEPNVRHALAMGFDGYARMSEIVATATHELAPGATVVGISESGGLHMWWVDGVLKTGAGRFYDAASAHGYEINSPIGPVSHQSKFGLLRASLDQAGLQRVRLWDTETGVGSWGRWGGVVVSDAEMERRARASSQFDPRSPQKVGRSWRAFNEDVASAYMVRSATQKLSLGAEQIHWFKWRAHEISWVHDYDPGGNPVPKLMNPVHAVLAEVLLRYGWKPVAGPPLASPDPRFALLAHRFSGPEGTVTVLYAHPKTGGFVVEDQVAAEAPKDARIGEPVIPAEEGKKLADLPPFNSALFRVTVPGLKQGAVVMDILARQSRPVPLRGGAGIVSVSQRPVYVIEPAPGRRPWQP